MKTVIEMAREAGFDAESDTLCQYEGWVEPLTRFAELVRADERNRTWTQEHWTEYEYSIAAAENEACAKLCDGLDDDIVDGLAGWQYGEAIRARMKK